MRLMRESMRYMMREEYESPMMERMSMSRNSERVTTMMMVMMVVRGETELERDSDIDKEENDIRVRLLGD